MQRTTKYVLCILSLVIAIGLWLKATVIQVPSGSWAPAGNMAEARSGAASALLQDGTIMVTGGEAASVTLASAEFFNAGSFAAAPAMNVARSRHAAVVLEDGRVLVTGGKTSGGGVTNAAEVYSPALNSWIVIASMVDARSGHTATLLKDGRVLLVGGESSAGTVSTLEVFDPATGAFTFAGTMSSARKNHAAALLTEGSVLIAGGSDGANALSSTEIYDAATGTVVAGPVLSTPRVGVSATTLMDGKVLIAGGNNGTADLATAEIFNSETGILSPLGSSLANSRRDHSAFLLPNNNHVLIVGGTSSGTSLTTTELFRPWDGNFYATGSMSAPRVGFSGSPLGLDGLFLASGGDGLASSELYGFATIKTDKDDYAPGQIVTMTGSGWQPGETVSLFLHEINNPDPHDDLTLTAVADVSGRILNNQFAPDEHDLGIRFYLTATGASSQAQTTFTDGTPRINSITNNLFSPNQPSSVNVKDTTDMVVRNQGAGGLNNVRIRIRAGTLITGTVIRELVVASSLAQGTNSSPITWNGQDTGGAFVTDGTYTARALALGTPASGSAPENDANNDKAEIVVDNTNPTVSLLAPADGGTVSGPFSVEASPLDSDGSGIDKVEFYVDGVLEGTDSSPNNGSTTNLNANSFTSGNHTWFAKAFDKTGNNAISASRTFNIAAPNAAPTLAAIGNKTVNEGALLSFTATATDPDSGQTLTFSLDPGGPAGASITSAGAFTWTPTEAQGPGDYPVTIRVTDNGTPALNDFETISIHVNEVNAAPVLDPIGNKTVDEETQLSFTATATDADLPANTLTFSLDAGAPAGASITSAGAFTWTPTEAQGPGDYPVTIRVTDNGTPALNDFETISIHVNEVNKAPELAAIGNKTVDEEVQLSFTATATDADLPANTLTFSLDAGAPAGASITSAGAFTWTPTEAQGPGDYPVTIRVTDNGTPALNDFETISIHVNEVNKAPELAAIGNKTVDEELQLSFTATATDADLPANTLTFSLDAGAPAGASITSAGAFTWTPTEAQGPGDYSVTIRVTDNGTPALSGTETISIHVNEVNAAPELAAIGNKTVDEEVQLSFTATATDADLPANTLTFSLDAGAPAGASITSAGAFTWTPTEAQGPGDYPVTIRVTDNGTPALNDFETISIHVNEVNKAPELAAIGNKTVDEEVQLSFTATATDADLPANTLTFSLDAGAPAGASITSAGAFTWTPTEAQGPGDYPVTIRVTDNGTPALNDFETISIHVNEVNKAPELAAIGSKTVLWGNALSFTATASDPDVPANVLTFSLVGAPAGASISGAGAFSWTPTSGQLGSHTFTVKVVDNGSPSLSDQEAITVVVGQRPTLLVYGGDSSGQYSDSVSLKATLTDNGGGVMQGNGISGKTVSLLLGSQSASDDTDSTGLTSANLTLTQAANSYSVNSSFAGDLLYLSSSDSDPFTLTQENAQIQYTGVDTVAQVGATLTLRATVWDSAASGYGGIQPESSPGAAMGNITKMSIAFDIYPAGSCGSGTPVRRIAQVIDSGTIGDGIGSATETLTSSSETSYCVIASLAPVANGGGPPTPNQFYTAEQSLPVGLAFYVNTGQFVTAGGWIYDANPNHGNFGLNARNNKNGQAQGQMVYIYRGLYNGVAANYIIKSNSLTNFGIASGSGGAYPMAATLQGKCNLQINRASDGLVLFSEGNATFSATVIDTNQNSGSGSESYAVTVYNKDAVLYKSVAQSYLQGGNVVVHIK